MPASSGRPLLRKGWSERAKTNGSTGRMQGLKMVRMPPRYGEKKQEDQAESLHQPCAGLSLVKAQAGNAPYILCDSTGSQKLQIPQLYPHRRCVMLLEQVLVARSGPKF